MIRVGIVGASGYMGGEVLRVLLDHPEVDIQWATTRSGKELAEFHPNLYGEDINWIHPDKIAECDVAFVALPTGAAIEMTQFLLQKGSKVIDMGAAFRLRNQSQWQSVYGMEHDHWHLVDQAVYGITELYTEQIKTTQLVANPGCFSSSAILGLAPLVNADIIDLDKLIVNGLSGTAGVGAELSRAAHHPEIANNLVPYNVIDHRHSYEMEQELSCIAKQKATLHFTPTYVPIVRGILNVCHAFPKAGEEIQLNREQLLALYSEFYSAHDFVKVYDLPQSETDAWHYKPYPWVSSVAGSNYCYIGLDIDVKRQRIVVFSVLDSIGKGGAQVGIENMNIMFGLERGAGLSRRACHPI